MQFGHFSAGFMSACLGNGSKSKKGTFESFAWLLLDPSTTEGSDSAVVREMRSRSNPRRNVPGLHRARFRVVVGM